MRDPNTARGRATKAQIIAAAAKLMHRRGVSATTVDEVLRAAGAGKGQFYHYFRSKDDLVEAVLEHQLERVLRDQRAFDITTWEGLSEWLEALVVMQEKRGFYAGCPLGSLVAEISDASGSSRLRTVGAAAFGRWESELAAALERMRTSGVVRPDVDVQVLSEAVIATIQGGYLLAAAKQRVEPMRHAVRAAFGLVRSAAA